MKTFYTVENNVQILISLLKQHGIRKVVASPGTANMTLVASMQCDDWFEIYSSVDERSAAYMAIGMSIESGEPVVITCTEATASRNYMSAMTEAYYRKIPILAVTGSHGTGLVGNNIPQVIDRSYLPRDVALKSVELPAVRSRTDQWFCINKANEAILELSRRGGGPVHINLVSGLNRAFSEKQLFSARIINRYFPGDELPKIQSNRKIAILIGSHKSWHDEELNAIEMFCQKTNAAVFVEHISQYKGKFKILFPILTTQKDIDLSKYEADLLISIGDVPSVEFQIPAKTIWRVSPDGEIRDDKKHLNAVFEMNELTFFTSCSKSLETVDKHEYYDILNEAINNIRDFVPQLPLSNIWIAQQTSKILPKDSAIYMGILNSVRAWNFFELPDSINCYSNVGGFGIDGGMSTLIGASLINKDKLYFCVLGDLSFFYDMNVLGNRHIGSNVRILLINNGCGMEFKNYSHPAYVLDDNVDLYIAAKGHFGNKSKHLVKHFAEDLGFKYMSASNKDEFCNRVKQFVSNEPNTQSIVFEVFTESDNENKALELIQSVSKDNVKKTMNKKAAIKKIIGEKNLQKIRLMLNQ